jgi:8-oxo-dGTP pyrophosphatase MutT (NUDIX family)
MIATEAHAPAQAVLAATVILIRDTPGGLETLMVERHHGMDFARGATVFPGGKVAVADHDDRLRDRCADAGLDDLQRALRVAAARETFEESGLLIARRGGRVLGAGGCAELWRRWHRRVIASAGAFVDMICDEGLELVLDLLVPYAQWVTPEISSKRFDTYFFVAQAPAGQLAVHDGFEAIDSFWVRPVDALAECEQRRRVIMFPTLCNLALLAQAADVTSALKAAQHRKVDCSQPMLARRADGKITPVLAADSGYPALSGMLMDQVAR